MLTRFVFSLVICLFLSEVAPAQNGAAASGDDPQARLELKQKAFGLLEQTLKDAESLKLSENRVLIFAAAADLLWKQDEARARSLFERAAVELAAVFNQSEPNESGLPENFWILQNSRNALLNQISNRDPELALKLLRQTRPPAFAAILNLPEARSRLYQNLYSQARNDLHTEQNFAAQIARRNPRRALEIARENLSKGASYADLSLIEELKNKDPEAAAKFADEVLQKLAGANFAEAAGHNDRSIVSAFLSRFSSPIESVNDGSANQTKSFRVNEAGLRGLAEKYYAYFFSDNFSDSNFYEIENALPFIAKILPERAPNLKRKLDALKQKQVVVNPQNQFYERLNKLNSSAAPDAMLAEADDFPIEMRSQIYNSAAHKLMQAGDAARARQLLASLPPGQNRDYALFNLDQQIVNGFLSKEQYPEAEAVARQQTDRSRKIHFLSVIAQYLAGKKQIERAAQIAAEAFALVNPAPEDFKEMNDLQLVLNLCAAIQPDRAFEMLEAVVPKFNELIHAAALLNKYQPDNQSFRDGEFTLSSIGFGGYGRREISFGGHGGRGMLPFSTSFSSLGVLAKTDLQRAAGIADRFERSDMRTAARLMILRSVFPDDGSTPNANHSITELPINGRIDFIH